jgi:PAS domain S-box-containing protein
MSSNEPEERLKESDLVESNLESSEIIAKLEREMSFIKAIENSIPSGIAVVDNQGKQVYVNQSFCRMIGWDEAELLEKYPPYVYWAADYIKSINNALKLTLENNAPKEGFDLVFCHKSGKPIPVNVIISTFVQEKDKIFYLANVIDITERKKAEEVNKKSQLLLMSSIESQKGTTIFSIDRDYRYLYFNKAHSDSMKFAYNMDVKIGINILDCVTSEVDRKQLKENFDRALKGESHSLIQTFGNVNLAYYEVFFNPIENENNEIIGCTGLARNITERKQAEVALKESETKFREIINQINDVIIVFDENGKIIVWNNGAEQICGLQAEYALNRSIVDIQHQFTPAPYNDKTAIAEKINGIIKLQNPEIFNQIIDSEILPINSDKVKNIQSIVFPIALDGYYLFCTVIRDTTEMKEYEKELLRISEDKDKFYSIIAQYLYNPFNLFHNFTKMMADDLTNLSIREIQKMVVTMSKSATNLYSLLDNMLQYTRINQGKIAFNPQKLNLSKTIGDAVVILKQNADAKNITISQNAENEITVFADIFMLKTILRNLISNAIKFTNNDGHITISVDQTTSNVTVSVSDTGDGIAPDYLKKMFNISQIHTALGTSDEKGTTLGLLLCKEFVEKHGGKIWVESKIGRGSIFNFTLPVFAGNRI